MQKISVTGTTLQRCDIIKLQIFVNKGSEGRRDYQRAHAAIHLGASPR